MFGNWTKLEFCYLGQCPKCKRLTLTQDFSHPICKNEKCGTSWLSWNDLRKWRAKRLPAATPLALFEVEQAGHKTLWETGQ